MLTWTRGCISPCGEEGARCTNLRTPTWPDQKKIKLTTLVILSVRTHVRTDLPTPTQIPRGRCPRAPTAEPIQVFERTTSQDGGAMVNKTAGTRPCCDAHDRLEP